MSVMSLSISEEHKFTKNVVDSIVLVRDLGVEGDCHFGDTVQHRSRMKIRPKPKNLRQVHLIPFETLQERQLEPGDIGENITTIGLDLLSMSAGTKLRFVTNGANPPSTSHTDPVVVLTGLRNPCPQIEKFRTGLQETFIIRGEDRSIVGRLAGVMSTVEVGGEVRKDMRIVVEPPHELSELLPV